MQMHQTISITVPFYPFRDPKHLIYCHDPMSGCPFLIMNVTVNNGTLGLVFINERPPGYRSNCPGDDTGYTGIELCEKRLMGSFNSRNVTLTTILLPNSKKLQCTAMHHPIHIKHQGL